MSPHALMLKKSNGQLIEATSSDQGEMNLSSGDVLAVTVADDDSEDFSVCRALYVGTGGNVKVLTEQGQTVTFVNVSDGFVLPVRCTRVFDTDTTADDILALR